MEAAHTFCRLGASEVAVNSVCRSVSRSPNNGLIQGVGISPQRLVFGLHCCGVISGYVRH